MADAARALDEVSDQLGAVIRRADELLADWSRFGAEVRAQVEREAAAVGAAVDGAIARAASAGLDRAIADRLRTLSGELERLEQRARAASRAAGEQRRIDRRLSWALVAGVALANALLIVGLVRTPEPAASAAPVMPVMPVGAPPPAAAIDPAAAATGEASPAAATIAPAGDAGSASAAPRAGSAAPPAAATSPVRAGSAAAPVRAGSAAAAEAPAAAGAGSAVAPGRGGVARPHKKLP